MMKQMIKELFDSLKIEYPNKLKSMKGSKFVFYYVQFLYFKCHQVNLNCGGSWIDSSEQ